MKLSWLVYFLDKHAAQGEGSVHLKVILLMQIAEPVNGSDGLTPGPLTTPGARRNSGPLRAPGSLNGTGRDVTSL